jgi:Chaperone of endosialidase
MKDRNTISICTTILLVLTCFGLFPKAEAVIPAPDGGYPGHNTAEGQNSLFSLTTGTNNTAVGWFSLKTLTTGQYNTAIGSGTLSMNAADFNTATGAAALWQNTSGASNTANGFAALFSNTSGNANTAVGFEALQNNNGLANTAIGVSALRNNTTGSFNVALGNGAGFNVSTADNVIALGSAGENAPNSCYIGNIFGVTSSGATAVYINTFGRLGTFVSSRRFKEEVKPMDKASEAILALKPVTFRYKEEIDPARSPQFGLVAEDVEKVNPDLVVRDAERKVNTVRYDAINAMLLNEFLIEHRKVEEQARKVQEQEATTAQLKSTVAQQQKEIQALTASLKEQITQIRKMSAQLAAAGPSHGGLAVSKARSRVALNDP